MANKTWQMKARLLKVAFCLVSVIAIFAAQGGGESCDLSGDVFAIPRAEFAKYFCQITGKAAPDGMVEFAIDPKVSKSGNDAYTIISVGSRVTITGSNLRSVLYGVYDLLARRGGCRWFWDGDIVPKKNTFDFSNLDIHEESRFEYRGIRYFAHRGLTRFQAEHWGFDDWKREIDWCIKNRLNIFMLRIGQDDLFQKAFPDVCSYPDPSKPIPEAMGGYNNRSLFWSLQFRGELRKKVMDYAFARGMMAPEDFGTMSHWYSRTPKSFLEKMNPPFLPQQGGSYGEPTDRVWDIRDRKWLDAYWQLTETSIANYGKPDLLHTIGVAERHCFTNRADNLKMKCDMLDLLVKNAAAHYPKSKVLFAGWDFYSSWQSDEVRQLVQTLDPDRILLWDYEADANNRTNFTEWDVIGKFPYTFGIFLCYESGLDIRADYRLICERQRLVENDPMCKGYILWPESSHTDSLCLKYFTANAWRGNRDDTDALLAEFCRDRYRDQANDFESLWRAVLPVSTNCVGWGGNYGKFIFGALADPKVLKISRGIPQLLFRRRRRAAYTRCGGCDPPAGAVRHPASPGTPPRAWRASLYPVRPPGAAASADIPNRSPAARPDGRCIPQACKEALLLHPHDGGHRPHEVRRPHRGDARLPRLLRGQQRSRHGLRRRRVRTRRNRRHQVPRRSEEARQAHTIESRHV